MLKKSKDLIDDTVRQIHDFQSGKIKPLSTGIYHLDQALLGGFRPSDVVAICANPFHGKTFMAEQISLFMEKEYEDVIFIRSLWEIEFHKNIVRELSKGSGKSVKEVLNSLPDDETKKKYKDVLEKYRKDNIYIQQPVTPDEFEKDILEIIEQHEEQKIGVVIDNLENLLISGQGQKEAMDDLLRRINVLKKKHKFIFFIILNQLNRSLEERTDNPKMHFPRKSDVYGSDLLYKTADVMVIKNMAYRLGISNYGVCSVNRYKYLEDEHKNVGNKTFSFKAEGRIFYHYIKMRNVEETYDLEDLFVEKIFDVPEDSLEEVSGEDFEF